MYKETKPPCYQCPKRHPWCHSTCPDYLDWQRERQDMLDERRKMQDIVRQLNETEVNRNRKIKGKKKNKRSFGR